MTELDDLTGYERAIGPRRSRGPRHAPALGGGNWADARRERERYTDRDPEVVVRHAPFIEPLTLMVLFLSVTVPVEPGE